MERVIAIRRECEKTTSRKSSKEEYMMFIQVVRGMYLWTEVDSKSGRGSMARKLGWGHRIENFSGMYKVCEKRRD